MVQGEGLVLKPAVDVIRGLIEQKRQNAFKIKQLQMALISSHANPMAFSPGQMVGRRTSLLLEENDYNLCEDPSETRYLDSLHSWGSARRDQGTEVRITKNRSRVDLVGS